MVTGWFDVRQGDSLSPTLFSIFRNDLAQEINGLNAGVMIGGPCLSIILYADDIVLLAPKPENLPCMLDTISAWCNKWCMQINPQKTQVLHARNRQRPRSTFQFSCTGAPLAYTESYKYLGYFVHEHINNEHHVEILTNAASRSFARIHSIFKSIGNMGLKSYETLYNAYVLPIMNYASGIWGFSDFSKPQVLQNRITRLFLGVHRLAPLAATKSELDWIGCREARWIEMLRLFNRFNGMDKSRLPNIILKWDQSLGLNTWYSEIQCILAYLGLNIRPTDGDQYDLTNAYNYLLKTNRSSWQLEASRKPKLRTYIKIHDFSKIQTLVKANITRYQRSILTQLKCGILPLKYETDRYQGIAPENRVCDKICDMNVPKD